MLSQDKQKLESYILGTNANMKMAEKAKSRYTPDYDLRMTSRKPGQNVAYRYCVRYDLQS